MPMMKPPCGYNGVTYNGVKVPPGTEINVLVADVETHLAAGWVHTGSMTAGTAPVAVAMTTEEGE
mgnify:CR=1 FL=1